MFSKKLVLRALLGSVLALTLAACGGMMTDDTTERGSIAEIASANANLSTLVAALDEAGFVPLFADDAAGPFTVFAPTNAAFAALLGELGITAEQLLESKDLASILTYHVSDEELFFDDLTSKSSISTLNGIAINQSGGVLDGYSNVITGEIVASNGVIYLVDAVLQPKDIVDVAITDGRFTTLVAAVVQEELVDTLRGDGPFTVFAPTDDGFAAALTALDLTAEELLALPNLTDILLYHVVAGAAVDAETVISLSPGTITTAEGSDISFDFVDGGVVLNDTVNVVITDILATNGIIHAIDFVLLPPTE